MAIAKVAAPSGSAHARPAQQEFSNSLESLERGLNAKVESALRLPGSPGHLASRRCPAAAPGQREARTLSGVSHPKDVLPSATAALHRVEAAQRRLDHVLQLAV